MADKTFLVEIVTPRKVIFSGQVISFNAPGVLGYFQVLYNHADLLAEITIGCIKILTAEGKEIYFATSGGFVEVKNNRVVVLADSAERSDEIDIQRSEMSKQRAIKRLEERSPGIDIDRAQASLKRAMNRLKIAQKI